jgi:hypothetical protein
MQPGCVEIKAFVPARDFDLVDPSGVLWRIAQNIPAAAAR